MSEEQARTDDLSNTAAAAVQPPAEESAPKTETWWEWLVVNPLKNRKEAHYRAYYKKHLTAEKNPKKAEIGPFSMWNNVFPNFLMTYLGTIRGFLTMQIFPGFSILPEEPKDMFWTLSQINWGIGQGIQWIKWVGEKIPPLIKTILILDWLPSAVRDVGKWLSQQKWLMNTLTYVPFVGLGISALIATKDFYYAKNKNLPTTLKFIADVSGAVLLGVGLGLIKWGGIAAAVYTGPALIIVATAIVVAVGLVKASHHLYKAWEDPVHRKQHLVNALKEFICTFISTASMVLTIFGMQSVQQLKQFSVTPDWSLLTKAGDIYKETATLSNAMLAAGGALTVMNIAPKLYNKGKRIIKKCFGSKDEENNVDVEMAATKKADLTKKIDTHIAALDLDLDTEMKKEKPLSTNLITRQLDERLKTSRTEKKDLLNVAKIALEKGKREILVKAERAATEKNNGVYQTSFWCVKEGETQRLISKALEMLPPEKTQPSRAAAAAKGKTLDASSF